MFQTNVVLLECLSQRLDVNRIKNLQQDLKMYLQICSSFNLKKQSFYLLNKMVKNCILQI